MGDFVIFSYFFRISRLEGFLCSVAPQGDRKSTPEKRGGSLAENKSVEFSGLLLMQGATGGTQNWSPEAFGQTRCSRTFECRSCPESQRIGQDKNVRNKEKGPKYVMFEPFSGAFPIFRPFFPTSPVRRESIFRQFCPISGRRPESNLQQVNVMRSENTGRCPKNGPLWR